MSYRSKPRWTWTQEQYLLKNAGTMHDIDIAQALGKTLKSIRRKREELGVRKVQGRGKCEVIDLTRLRAEIQESIDQTKAK